MLLKGTFSAPWLLYEVSDPAHPRLLCTISNTSAHVLTGDTFEYLNPVSANETDVIVHSMRTGNESLAGALPFHASSGAWLADQSLVAYTMQASQTDPNAAFGGMEVWLYTQRQNALLFTYSMGIGDCICRFGLPPEVLAFSPDGEYLVAGRLAGKGSDPLALYRVSDRTRAATLDQGVSSAFWDRSGHRLFLNRFGHVPEQAWTPEGGVVAVTGAADWAYIPSVSPDGSLVAYTAYMDPANSLNLRTYIYDQKAGTTRMLIDKPRSQVLFLKDGWVWHLEEITCQPNAGCTGGTMPSGKVFAMQLSTGTETEVTFVTGESPVISSGSYNWSPLVPGEYWPAL